MKIVTLADAQHLVGQDLGVSEWTLIDQKMIDELCFPGCAGCFGEAFFRSQHINE